MIIGIFLFIVSIWLDNETRKISIASIVAIILTIIAVISMTMSSNVINSLKYSNEPYIIGKALLVGKYVRNRTGKGAVHKFLLPNGKIIERTNGNYEYYILNKPRGVISTSSDEKGRKTVVDLINTKTRKDNNE